MYCRFLRTEARGGHPVPCSIAVCCIHLRQVSHWLWSQAGTSKRPQSSCPQAQPCCGCRCRPVWPCLAFYVSAWDSNSGPQACIANTLTCWAITLDLSFVSPKVNEYHPRSFVLESEVFLLRGNSACLSPWSYQAFPVSLMSQVRGVHNQRRLMPDGSLIGCSHNSCLWPLFPQQIWTYIMRQRVLLP